jgi:hypothetical protein
MDQKALIANLHTLFCNERKESKKYSKVWLSQPEPFRAHKTRRYILNVQAEHPIKNCNDEIREIVQLLNDKANQELQTILRVDVYHSADEYFYEGDDLVIFEEPGNCK